MGSWCDADGTPPGHHNPLQQLSGELELHENLVCSGRNVGVASRKRGDPGERGLRAVRNRRLSGAVTQGREIVAEFNE